LTSDSFNVDDLEIDALESRLEMAQIISTCDPNWPKIPPVMINSTCTPF